MSRGLTNYNSVWHFYLTFYEDCMTALLFLVIEILYIANTMHNLAE